MHSYGRTVNIVRVCFENIDNVDSTNDGVCIYKSVLMHRVNHSQPCRERFIPSVGNGREAGPFIKMYAYLNQPSRSFSRRSASPQRAASSETFYPGTQKCFPLSSGSSSSASRPSRRRNAKISYACLSSTLLSSSSLSITDVKSFQNLLELLVSWSHCGHLPHTYR